MTQHKKINDKICLIYTPYLEDVNFYLTYNCSCDIQIAKHSCARSGSKVQIPI